jgi:AraC family transcriptional regulator of adaptative response/methylated-DNA-[protein]-cysteine methyltransferase
MFKLFFMTNELITQQQLNYTRIAEAIAYIQNNFTSQPSFEEIAKEINVSPYHFHKMFTDWAGVSPKKFLQYITVQHARAILKHEGKTVFDASFETGLSGTGRLHDLFISIEGMTPGEYKHGGKNLTIHYSFAETPFGQVLIASTYKGICYMAFVDDTVKAFDALRVSFPNASFKQITDTLQQQALYIFTHSDWTQLNKIKLHLKATPFQLKVWETLLKIPVGSLSTYGNIAKQMDAPNASRAVGTAIGKNPVAFLIPCHRVIQSSGLLGGYHWGGVRKASIIGWEAARMEHKGVDVLSN